MWRNVRQRINVLKIYVNSASRATISSVKSSPSLMVNIRFPAMSSPGIGTRWYLGITLHTIQWPFEVYLRMLLKHLIINSSLSSGDHRNRLFPSIIELCNIQYLWLASTHRSMSGLQSIKNVAEIRTYYYSTLFLFCFIWSQTLLRVLGCSFFWLFGL